jgi:hypothetical protein
VFDPFAMRYYGPGGAYCGKVSGFGDSVTIVLASGDGVTYSMTTTSDGGVEIACDSGFTFRLTGEQMDAMSGCGGQTGDDGGTRCEPAPGSFLAPCVFGASCEEGLDCCGSIWSSQDQCLPSGICDLVCAQNLECGSFGHDWICCSNGLFDQCLPVDACQ